MDSSEGIAYDFIKMASEIQRQCCEADSLLGQSNSQLLVVFQYAQKWQEKKIYPSCLIWSAAKWKDVIEM